MMIRILLSVLALVATATSTEAMGTSTSPDRWSDLTIERLQRLPPPVRAALLKGQKVCGEEHIGVRSGFVRYLKDANGNELVVLHFDQVRCANRSALCTSTGCLHQVFLAHDGLAHREVWHGHVREVDLTGQGGRISANVACDRHAGYCAVNRHFKMAP